jgi:hypothetical protein
MASSVLFGRSADDGETWLAEERVLTEEGGSPSILCDDIANIYVVCNAGDNVAFLHSSDNGDVWTQTEAGPRYDPCHLESYRISFQWADSTSFHLVYGDYVNLMDFDSEFFYVKLATTGDVIIPRVQLSAGTGLLNNYDFARSMVALDNATILIGACQRMDWDWGGTAFGVPYTLRAIISSSGSEEPRVATSILGHPILYPNPTRGHASLRYSLEGREDVSATVYDVSGRLVRELLRASVGPGDHLITWDGRNNAGARATEGVYILKVQAGQSDWSRKIVINR